MDTDKKLGLFIGLAIGGALGAPLEFQKLENGKLFNPIHNRWPS